MESKSDYFRSPHPRNVLNLYSPFGMIKNQNNGSELFQSNLFSPLKVNSGSPFHYVNQNASEMDNVEKKLISNKLDFEAHSSEQNQISPFGHQIQHESFSQQTPQKQKLDLHNEQPPTTPSRKYELRPFQQKNHLIRDTQKGLRGLSKQAFEVLKNEKKSLTYQEVALKIISDNDEFGESTTEKQKQSIKRRVYDALNVLIAAGLLKKNGKKIYYIEEKKEVLKKSDASKDIQQEIQAKKRIISALKADIKSQKVKLLATRKLLTRNQENYEQFKEKERLYFPFVAGKHFKPNYATQKNKKVMEQFLGGDLDVITKINFSGKQG